MNIGKGTIVVSLTMAAACTAGLIAVATSPTTVGTRAHSAEDSDINRSKSGVQTSIYRHTPITQAAPDIHPSVDEGNIIGNELASEALEMDRAPDLSIPPGEQLDAPAVEKGLRHVASTLTRLEKLLAEAESAGSLERARIIQMRISALRSRADALDAFQARSH